MPVLFEKQTTRNTRVALWKITEEDEALLQMLPSLQKREKGILGKIKNQHKRSEWLASRLLIYNLTGLYPEILYNNNRQPILGNSSKNISITHTIGYAAIALSDKTVPGIDIEYPSQRIEKVSHRFLSNVEKQFISATEKEKQLGLIWCAKEAVYKKAGEPRLIFNEQIVITPFVPKACGTIQANLFGGGKKVNIELEYNIDNNFYLVWTL